MKTIPFYLMINEDSEIWSIIDKTTFPHLFPQNVENLTSDMIDNISEHFYYRQIGFSSPTRFLRHFYRLIRERASTWKRLIDTEKALRPDDMLYNYDLTENERTDNATNSTSEYQGETSNVRTPNLTTTSTDSNNRLNKMMDTPDGTTTDIDNYLSQAEKEVITDNASTVSTGTETNNTTSDNSSSNTASSRNTRELTRKGNIGVMTSAQILGGYREAQLWDAYNQIIFPEIEQLFLSTVDIDDIDLW